MVSYSVYHHATAAKSLQSCPTLRNPIDSSPPGFPIPGILQARTLEWVAISFSNEWKWKVKVKSLSRVWLFLTPWTAAYRAPPSMGFSRQEYWSGCHCLLRFITIIPFIPSHLFFIYLLIPLTNTFWGPTMCWACVESWGSELDWWFPPSAASEALPRLSGQQTLAELRSKHCRC